MASCGSDGSRDAQITTVAQRYTQKRASLATMMIRRRFLNWFLGVSSTALLASILYPVLRFISPPEVPEATTNQVEAGATNDPELLERGFKIVRFGSEPVILIRVAETDFRAFSATCTHLDCIVEYHREHEGGPLIWCNCHNGQFNLQGLNIGGPPPRPLEPFKVDLVSQGAGQVTKIVVSRA
jgi:Rieske Fe-S protein